MGLMASGGHYNETRNSSHWLNHKCPSFPCQDFSDNTNWETAAVNRSADEECWGCTISSVYLAYRLHTYRNCPNNMDPDVAERAKQSAQEYAQRNSSMGGTRGLQGIQYGRGQTSSTKKRSMFADHRAQLPQLWNKEVLSLVDRDFLMYEMVDPSTSRPAQVTCAAAIKNNNNRENRNRGYEDQIEGPYSVGKIQNTREHIKSNDQLHSHTHTRTYTHTHMHTHTHTPTHTHT